MSKTQFLAHIILKISVFLFPDWKLIIETQQLKWLGQKNTSKYEKFRIYSSLVLISSFSHVKNLILDWPKSDSIIVDIDHFRLLSHNRTLNWVLEMLFTKFHSNPLILTWDTSVSLHGLKPIDSYVQRVKTLCPFGLDSIEKSGFKKRPIGSPNSGPCSLVNG